MCIRDRYRCVLQFDAAICDRSVSYTHLDVYKRQQYNSVNFGTKALKTVTVNAMAQTGGSLQIRPGSINGAIIAKLQMRAGKQWLPYKAKLLLPATGLQNIFLVSRDSKTVEVDWIRFQ